MKRLVLLFLFLSTCICMDAQTGWKGLVGKKMPLVRYGLYQNNREMNSFTPSATNKNQGEYILLNSNGTINWMNAEGNHTYSYRILGSYLYFNNSWFRIERDENGMIFTVSKENTYRYFSKTGVEIHQPGAGVGLSSGYNNSSGYTTGGFSSGSSTNSSSYTKCTDCNGTGRCRHCNGRGTSILTGHTETCVICRGSGTCKICFGRGKL